jgi:serine/tyrosine/threonine adenylyltransferase
MPTGPGYRPAPVWPTLQPNFSDVVKPATFPRLQLRYRNHRAAAEIGLDSLDDHEWLDHFGALTPLPRNIPEPLALRYHGHQFQNYNPWLGDGRGFLLAQVLDERGRVMDLGTKGSGTTPYSRGGDGRLTLKGAVREILATEMLQALGVNTSRTLSVVETGESLVRHDEPSPTRAAVMVRLSWSHVRFGTFQRHAWERSTKRLRTLLHFAVDSWFPDLAEGDESDLPERFLDVVVDRSARLVAQWTMAGFVHGVLNTDNMNVTGESFDYGPWRFLPTYDPEFTAAYFDHGGLYAFGRQGDAMFWNLCRLADALVSISHQPALEAALKRYEGRLARHSRAQLLTRLGVGSTSDTGDHQLLASCFSFLGSSQIPYERVFFDWFGGEASRDRAERGAFGSWYAGPEFEAFRDSLFSHPSDAGDRLAHPYFEDDTPSTMLIDEMEALWSPIAEHDDWSVLDAGIKKIRRMGDALGHSTL